MGDGETKAPRRKTVGALGFLGPWRSVQLLAEDAELAQVKEGPFLGLATHADVLGLAVGEGQAILIAHLVVAGDFVPRLAVFGDLDHEGHQPPALPGRLPRQTAETSAMPESPISAQDSFSSEVWKLSVGESPSGTWPIANNIPFPIEIIIIRRTFDTMAARMG